MGVMMRMNEVSLWPDLVWEEATRHRPNLKPKDIIFPFLLFRKTFLFVNVRAENAQRSTIRGRSRTINLDSFLICKTSSSCSMYVPRRGIIQYKPHYPIYRIITMKSICQSKILHKIQLKYKRMKIYVNGNLVSFNHLKAFFDAGANQHW